MRIALDAMGSDHFPAPDVEGAVQAAAEFGDTIVLLGDEKLIQAELAKHPAAANLPLEIHPTSHIIAMNDKPSKVVRGKPDSSMHIGMELVEKEDCQAFVSCGNTGAVLAIAVFQKLHRIKGIHRPALGAIVPFADRARILLDIGANADCKPEWLAQFALMGSLYAQLGMGIPQPCVALLSNGEEEGKGYSLVHDAAPLLSQMPIQFIGNIEPHKIVHSRVDVVVSDGFVGNIMVKSIEAMGAMLKDSLKAGVKENLVNKVGGLLLKPMMKRIYKQYDPFEIGGAPLLGVNGVVIVGHGRSNGLAVKNAIRQARQAVSGGLVEAIRRGIADYQRTHPSDTITQNTDETYVLQEEETIAP